MDGNTTKLVEHTQVTVGALHAVDEDTSDVHSYELLTYQHILQIVHSNQLTVKDPDQLDYETIKALEVEIKATDNAVLPLSVTKNFTFEIQDRNEEPVDILLSNNTVG